MQNTEIAIAAQWLTAGECVGIPTETVYGLAANALNPAAVVKIFQIKNRPAFDPLIVHIPDAEAAENYVTRIPPAARALMQAFWPGPLTLLLPRRDCIPDLVTSGLPNVGLRVPDHPLTLALLRTLPFPLAAPSANPFGYISPTTAQHVADQLGALVPFILDGGPCAIGVESTIVGFDAQDSPVVYRLGGLSVEMLEAVCGPVRLLLNQSSNPAAPGMLAAHYAPRKPLLLGNIGLLLKGLDPQKTALLVFGPQENLPAAGRKENLSPTGDLAEAARQIFALLRSLDSDPATTAIVAAPLPDYQLGRAINDRLRRAAAPAVTSQKEQLWKALRTVTDPEIPVLSVVDLGIVRAVEVDTAGRAEIVITPTYSGCPAMKVIEWDILATVRSLGFADVHVQTVLQPAWTTDWMTEEGREKLRAYGIAPPQERGRVNRLLFEDSAVPPCPHCGHAVTERISEFGSTACKELWRCPACLEPFDYFRCH